MVDLRCLKPLDSETIIRSVKKTGRMIGITEAYENSSFINEIIALVNEQAFDWLDAPIHRIAAAKNIPVPRAEVLEDLAIPNTQRIVETCRRSCADAKEVYIPKLGQTVEEVMIVDFLVEEGQKVSEGDEIMEVETDKAVFGIEANAVGYVHFGPYKLKDVVPILTVIAVIGKEGDVFSAQPNPVAEVSSEKEKTSHPQEEEEELEDHDSDFFSQDGERICISPSRSKDAKEKKVDITKVIATGAHGNRIVEKDILSFIDDEVKITPLAKKMAEEHRIDISTIHPASMSGKITKDDVQAVIEKDAISEQASMPAILDEHKIDGIRKIISERMHASSQITAPVTLLMDVDVSRLVELRETLKRECVSLKAPGYNEIFAKVCALALKQFPYMNARMTDHHTIQQIQDINIGVAVDTERGLLVPVIKNVNQKSIYQVTSEFQHDVDMIRESRVAPEILQDGTFTITNLGSYDVRAFTPIINLPETAILGLGKIEPRVVAVDNWCLCEKNDDNFSDLRSSSCRWRSCSAISSIHQEQTGISFEGGIRKLTISPLRERERRGWLWSGKHHSNYR